MLIKADRNGIDPIVPDAGPGVAPASEAAADETSEILTIDGRRLSIRMAWWMVAVLFSLYIFSWLDRMILSMLVTPIKADLALTDVQLGLILGPSFGIAYAVFALPLGWVADHFSRRWVILGGAITWALATIACGYARSFETLFVARVLVGAGEAGLLPAAYSLISDSFPRDRLTLATSVFQMASKFGSATAYGVGAAVIGLAAAGGGLSLAFIGLDKPWQMAMALVGAPVVVLAFLVLTFPEPRRMTFGRKADKSNLGELVGFIRDNGVLCSLAMLSFSAISIGGYALLNWLPTYMERHFGLEPKQYGVMLGVMNLIAAAALVGNGKFADYLFARGMKDVHLRLFSWQVAALVPALLVMFHTSSIVLVLLCFCIFEFVIAPLMMYVSALVALLAPSTVRAQLLAIYLFILTVTGTGVGPSLVGMLTDHVFRDESRLGSALTIVCASSIAIAWIAMRLALRHLRPAIERNLTV